MVAATGSNQTAKARSTATAFQFNASTNVLSAGGLSINKGSLGTVVGNALTVSDFIYASGNTSYMRIKATRLSDGSDWTTASTKLLQIVDATEMGYVEFNPNGANYGIAFGQGANEYMRILNGGNVGIGITDPTRKLDINGAIRLRSGLYDSNNNVGTAGSVLTSTGSGVSWSTATGGGTSPWSRKTTTYTAVAGDRLIADTSGGSFTITLPATPTTGNSVVFADGADWFTNNLTVARNSSTIEGVADDFVLDIKGIEVEFVYDGTTWEVFASTGPYPNTISAVNDTTSTTLYPVMVSAAGTNTTPKVTTTTNYLSFDATTGQITAIDFNSASDKNLKTNVSEINNSIEILKQLSPVSFNWATTGEKSYGLIAQEVEKILPELVSETNNVKSVRYIPLIAMLIDAIVELDKRIPND
ncbi:MAG: tail fiber domain-containing protein [Rhodobacteraceae bacterium]|nr:tail fiber domain-containing protein [Paracoccaceae bacterium]